MRSLLGLLACLMLVVGCSKEGRRAAKKIAASQKSPEATSALLNRARRAVPSAQADVGHAPAADSGARDGLIEVSGEQVLAEVRALKGKGTLVNVWASWCGPCRGELPMLLAVAENLRPEGVHLLLVSVDEPEGRERAVEFLQEHDAPLPSFVARRPLGLFKVALNPRWPGMLPATFLYDAQGKLHYFWGGPVYEQELLDVMDRFLAGTLVDGEARFGLAPGKIER